MGETKTLSKYETEIRADCAKVAELMRLTPWDASVLAEIFRKHGEGLHPSSPLMRLADAIRLSHLGTPT